MNKKSIFKKENIKPIATLSVICLIVALLLGVINIFTAPIVEKRKQEEIDKSFKDVLPEGEGFKSMELTADYPKEVAAAYKANGGYVFQLDVKGKEKMTLIVGVTDAGKVAGVKVITESETPGYKEGAFAELVGAESKYNGVGSDTLEKIIVTGATYTSNGIYSAVKAALDGYIVANGGKVELAPDEDAPHALPADLLAAASRDEEWALDMAKTVSGENVTRLDGIMTASERLMRVYKTESGKHVMYVAKRHDYVSTMNELEVFFVADKSGKITEFEVVTWLVGHKVDYDAEFVDSFIGKRAADLEVVDVVTGATGTSNNIRYAVAEALKTIYPAATAESYIAIAFMLACAAAFVAFAVYSRRRMRNEK